MSDVRRQLPSVNALLETAGVRALLERSPRALVLNAVRDAVQQVRSGAATPDSTDAWCDEISQRVELAERPSLRVVINATGIVLHTNLGRAPLARVAIDAMTAAASGYCNIEYDLDAGARGSRYAHCASLLRELTGAGDALVVNNGAAALVLALNTMASGREAILSRGELVEIGGSFRVHEIMAKSGALLREVGATNRTHVADYERALGTDTALILKVHRSNFAIEGFVSEATVGALAPLAAAHNLPIVHDLGSGLLISLDGLGLRGEPTATEALSAGASIVVMSGDKLLGGPQSGIILGDGTLIAQMRANPLARSYRVDKLTLAALETTLALYRDPARAMREIPTLAMLAASPAHIRARCERAHGMLAARGITTDMVESVSTVGAGAFPLAELPSSALALGGSADAMARKLRGGEPAVVGRVNEGRLLLDLRAVPDDQLDALVNAVVAAHA